MNLFLVISTLQVNLHYANNKKRLAVRVLHYITFDAEGTGFEVRARVPELAGIRY